MACSTRMSRSEHASSSIVNSHHYRHNAHAVWPKYMLLILIQLLFTLNLLSTNMTGGLFVCIFLQTHHTDTTSRSSYKHNICYVEGDIVYCVVYLKVLFWVCAVCRWSWLAVLTIYEYVNICAWRETYHVPSQWGGGTDVCCFVYKLSASAQGA